MRAQVSRLFVDENEFEKLSCTSPEVWTVTLDACRRIFADAADGVALATVQARSNAAIVGERARVIAASAGAIAQPKEIRHTFTFQAPRP